MKNQIDFYESYGYYHQPFWQNFYFKLFILSFLFLILGLFVFFIFKHFNKKKKKELPAWDWAFLELDKLNLKKCKTKNDFKKFYFDLTKIIKIYFYKRYAWQVLDKTDEELILFLRKVEFDSNLLQDLQTVFNDALFIKFAGQDVLKPQAEKDLKLIKNNVNLTIKKTL